MASALDAADGSSGCRAAFIDTFVKHDLRERWALMLASPAKRRNLLNHLAVFADEYDQHILVR